MTRKSPIKHPVKQHLREGKVVHHYERGSGKAPRLPIAHIRRGGGYTVTILGNERHTFNVGAESYLGALDAGLGRATETPMAIKLRRR